MAMDRKRIRRPTLPGEILAELYLRPYRVSIAKFAEAAGLSRKHVSALIHGRSAMTAATATRIAAVLGTTAQFWLNMQAAVDLYDADESLRHSERKPRRLPVFNAAA
ncbi:MAG: HigA family addiction module antitoxin [Alphaproteobacteria bacterium]